MTLNKTLLASILLCCSNAAVAFPAMPFCPFGGPPGWLNSLTNNNRVFPNYTKPPYPVGLSTSPHIIQPYQQVYNYRQIPGYRWRP